MDKSLCINEDDEPWMNYQKLLEINKRIKNNMSLTDVKEDEISINYNNVLKFINKILKINNRNIKMLTDFKNISETLFANKEKINKIVKKYGVPLSEQLNIEIDIEKINIIKILRKILISISYNLIGKKFKHSDETYYTIKEKNNRFTTKEKFDRQIKFFEYDNNLLQ